MRPVRRAGGELVALDVPEASEAGNRRRTDCAEAARLITEMHSAGMAPQAVADALNDAGVPPLARGDQQWLRLERSRGRRRLAP